MTTPIRDLPFRPNLSKAETKAEEVSRIAKSMIEQEVVKRDAKTARLREARLALEAEAQQKAKASPAAKPGTKRRAKPSSDKT